MAEVGSKSRAPSTRDALFGGRVVLHQPARHHGYRVNVDAILLAAFAAGRLRPADRPRRRARVAFDLGAGVGAVGLSLLHLDAASHVMMVESDGASARLARTNAEENGLADRIEVVCADVTRAARAHPARADLVTCNPPYVPPGRGRVPRPSVAAAKSGALGVFLDATRRILGRRARACFVYPAIEATTLLWELRARGLEPKRLRPVHGRPADDARVVLVECAAARPGGLSIEPPLVETDGRGKRTDALAALLGS